MGNNLVATLCMGGQNGGREPGTSEFHLQRHDHPVVEPPQEAYRIFYLNKSCK